MKRLHDLKLHEITYADKGTFSIIRVPGGWIYRFFELQHGFGPDGQLIQNYSSDSIFVPFNSEFMLEDSK